MYRPSEIMRDTGRDKVWVERATVVLTDLLLGWILNQKCIESSSIFITKISLLDIHDVISL